MASAPVPAHRASSSRSSGWAVRTMLAPHSSAICTTCVVAVHHRCLGPCWEPCAVAPPPPPPCSSMTSSCGPSG
eukprot:5806415-Lingulodinium_polyedra.AAC.1